MGLAVLQTAQNLLKTLNLLNDFYENRENMSVNFVTFVKSWYLSDKPSIAAYLWIVSQPFFWM